MMFCKVINKLKIIILLSVVYISLAFIGIPANDNPKPYILNYDTTLLEKPNIPANNPLTVEGVELGRLLFYDTLLSGNNTQSCASCHKQEFYFSDGKTTAIGSQGHIGKRNSMALVNLAFKNSFFWDGRVISLESLIKFPLTDSIEMQQDTILLIQEIQNHPYYPDLFKKAFGNKQIEFNDVSKAIAQFLRIIYTKGTSFNFKNENASKSFKFKSAKNSKENDSLLAIVNEMHPRFSLMCTRCHRGAVGRGDFFADINIDTNKITGRYLITKNLADTGKFIIPPLINVLHTAPYMHDGRFKTLREVLDHYSNHIGLLKKLNSSILSDSIENTITENDKKNIELFFEIFDDESIKTNKKYSNPFASPNFKWTDYPDFK